MTLVERVRRTPIRRVPLTRDSLSRELDIRSSRLRAGLSLTRVSRGSQLIVVGPWLGEVGFEVLYWIPMLRWFRERYGIERERLVAVSRGGVASWYADLAGHYLDALDYVTPQQLREHIGEPGLQKPRRLGALDRELIAHLREELGTDFKLLHPSIMYRLFRMTLVIQRARPLSELLSRTRFAPLPPAGYTGADAAPVEGLPADYVTVKAYFNTPFPDTPQNRAFVKSLVARLASSTDVVLLSTGIEIDDHVDAVAHEGQGRVHDLRELVTPRDNLDVQTRAIRHSRALFTTYGGFAYLAPFLGVPSFCFAANDDHNPLHLELMGRAARDLQEAGLSAGCTLMHTGALLELADLIGRGAPVPA